MNTKRILVSFLLIASVLLLTSMVSAYTVDGTNDYIQINGDDISLTASEGTYSSTLTAGDTLTVKVKFTVEAGDDLENIKVKATLEGKDDDVTVTTSAFDVEGTKTYTKTLTLEVPSDFEEEAINGTMDLILEIEGDEVATIELYAQRTSYEASIRTNVEDTVEAGETLSADVVVKNTGYNDLEDMYVTVSIAELDVSKKIYIGDLYNVFNEDEDEDDYNSIRTTLNLELPADAKAGVYTLKVEAKNDDVTNTETQEITVENSVSSLVLRSGNDLILLNPTNQLKVYTVKYASTESVVVMPAASSKTVTVEVPTSGDYKFDVSVMSGKSVLSTVNFEGTSETTQLTSPVFVLTVILAIVFLVLLVVLVVLITKKPQKAEEFGESYY